MAADADLVDSMRSGSEAAEIERVYELRQLTRLRDLLAEPAGKLRARFAFTQLATGRAGARVTVQSTPVLVCQRCLQGFAFEVDGGSEVEFAPGAAADSELESYETQNGWVRLSELAEEELLLALPIAPACADPRTCGNAPEQWAAAESRDAGDEVRRPFGELQELLKKTDRT